MRLPGVAVLLALLAGTAGACTSFADFSSGSAWYGMNFDWHPDVDILFRVEEPEGLPKVFTMSFVTGQGPVPTVGMTGDGRFCTMQVTDAPWTGPEASDDTPFIWTPFYALIYGGAGLSDLEAMAGNTAFAQYEDPPLHVMAADPSGAAMIIEVGENGNEVLERGEEPFLVMTNFSNCAWAGADPASIVGDGDDRYRTARLILEESRGALGVEACMSVLEATSSHSSSFPTRASMVFEPASGMIYIAVAGDFSKIWRLDLGAGLLSYWQGSSFPSALHVDSTGVTASQLQNLTLSVPR